MSSKLKRKGKKPLRSTSESLVKLVATEPITPLTMLLISYAVIGDWPAAERVLDTQPVAICDDLRIAGLVGMLPVLAITNILSSLLKRVASNGCVPADARCRAVALLFHAVASDLGLDEEFISSVNDAVQFKIETLFQQIPREDAQSIPLYAVRCGLVFGVVAVQENKRYKRKIRWWRRGGNAIAGIAGATAVIPDVAGVSIKDVVGAPVNAAATVAISSIDRIKEGLRQGLVHVEDKFKSQVLQEADEGLVASYLGNTPTDGHGNAIPVYSSERMDRFKLLAWRIFRTALRHEGLDTTVKKPESSSSGNQDNPNQQPPPRVSADTKSPKHR